MPALHKKATLRVAWGGVSEQEPSLGSGLFELKHSHLPVPVACTS